MSEHEEGQCRRLLGSLSDFIDGELEAEICAEIERHLSDCENCRVVVDTLRKTVELYHQMDDNEELPSDVRERLFFRLNLDEYFNKQPS